MNVALVALLAGMAGLSTPSRAETGHVTVNANGAILQLGGPKVGAEVSAAVGGVTIRLK